MFASQIQDVLCGAIDGRRVVELRYDTDLYYRTFEPHIVYRSTKNNICVAGTQTQNPNKPHLEPEPRIFDLSEVRDLNVTTQSFVPDPRFDRFDARYKNGVICSV